VMQDESIAASAGPEVTWEIDLPTKQITGHVLGADGRPLQAANVLLKTTVGETQGQRSVSTAADGAFDFAAVAAGDQEIVATAAGYLKESSFFTLREDDAKHDVTLTLQQGLVRTLRVFDSSGHAIPRAVVADETGAANERLTDDLGTLEIELRKGEQRTFYVMPPGGSFASVRVTAPAAEDTGAIDVSVPPGPAQLRVLARTRDDVPLPNVFFAMRYNGVMIPIGVQFSLLNRRGVPVQTGPDGVALLAALPAGIYEVWPYFTRAELQRITAGLVAPAARITAGAGVNVISFTFDSPGG